MSDWQRWTVQQWNERLLDHFFRKGDDPDGVVTTLLATQDEIARATGDAAADPANVHDAFIDTMLRSVRHRSLLDTAADYPGYPGPPIDDEIPPFVSHLILTCIAAAESSEDLAHEGSFVSRLRGLTNDQLPDPSLQLLPRLWQHLAHWLAVPGNAHRFKPLRLPDPGGLTRIGYTTKLAFPDRRDQRELSDLLDREGLLGHEPPIGKVLSLVARERARFRPTFIAAFTDFHRQFSTSSSRSTRLLEHRFWSAVREAALRGRGRESDVELKGRAQFLAELQDDQLVLLLVSDAALADGGSTPLMSHVLPFSYGPWLYGLALRTETRGLDGASLDGAVRALLAHEHRLQPLSGLIEQGILGFVETNHGMLELADAESLRSAQVALVRSEMVQDIVKIYGDANTRSGVSRYPGWVQIESPNLVSCSSQQLDDTALKRTWILHRSVSRLAVTLGDGVRTEDGWLGAHEVLPNVRAPDAVDVVASTGAEWLDLTKRKDGSWEFPSRDVSGAVEIRVQMPDGESATRTVRFSSAPTTENYKEPSDESAWIIEGLGGTSSLASTCPLSDRLAEEDASQLSEHTIYLGKNVGEFVTSASQAAWAVVEFGGSRTIKRCQIEPQPEKRSVNARARREWRKLLHQSEADPGDPRIADARRIVRHLDQPRNDATSGKHDTEGTSCELPDGKFAEIAPRAKPFALVASHGKLEKLVGAVAARANSKCGLSWREWSALVQVFLGIDEDRVSLVTRAWQECGAIDVLSASRWWHRCVFARRPVLVAYRVGNGVGATLHGLALATSRNGMLQAARSIGVATEERGSASPFVPSTVSFRARALSQIEDIGTKVGAKIGFLDTRLERFASACSPRVNSPKPMPYEWSKRWPTWSLTEKATPPGPTVEHWMREDRPSYWLVSGATTTLWSYDLNVARCWAATLAGELPLVSHDDALLEARHGYLSLPLARVVAVFATALAGPEPEHDWRYRYVFPSAALRDHTDGLMRAAFDLHRLRSTEED